MTKRKATAATAKSLPSFSSLIDEAVASTLDAAVRFFAYAANEPSRGEDMRMPTTSTAAAAATAAVDGRAGSASSLLVRHEGVTAAHVAACEPDLLPFLVALLAAEPAAVRWRSETCSLHYLHAHYLHARLQSTPAARREVRVFSNKNEKKSRTRECTCIFLRRCCVRRVCLA